MKSGSEKGGRGEASATPRRLGRAGRWIGKVELEQLPVSNQSRSRNLRSGWAASTTRSLPSRQEEATAARLPLLLLRRKRRHRGERGAAVAVAVAKKKKTGLQGARTSRKSRIERGVCRDADTAFELFRESLCEHKRGGGGRGLARVSLGRIWERANFSSPPLMDRIGTSTLYVSSVSDFMESDAVSIPIALLCRHVVSGEGAGADGEGANSLDRASGLGH